MARTDFRHRTYVHRAPQADTTKGWSLSSDEWISFYEGFGIPSHSSDSQPLF